MQGIISSLEGQKFGKLTVVGLGDKSGLGRGTYWLCKCECGGEKQCRAGALMDGHNLSCGCTRDWHGKSRTSTHVIWMGMRERCGNPKAKSYSYYGGRGIRVCERWNEFSNFLEDMGERPIGRSLNRVDNDGNYCKENCEWATDDEQSNNRSNNIVLTFRGESMTSAQWAKKIGLSRQALHLRLKSGWSIEKALTQKTRPQLVT